MRWSTRDVERVLRRLGFVRVRRGGHDLYVKEGHPRSVSVPRNARELPIGTVRSIWRQAGLTDREAEKLR